MKRNHKVGQDDDVREDENQGNQRHQPLKIGFSMADVVTGVVVALAKLDQDVGGEGQHDHNSEACIDDVVTQLYPRGTDAILNQKVLHYLTDRSMDTKK